MSYLISLIPLLWVTCGVFWESALAPTIEGAGLIILGLVFGLWTQTWHPKRIPWEWAWGVLALLGAVSLSVTALPDITLPKVAGFWSGLIWAYFLACWINDERKLTLLAGGTVLAGVVVAGLAPVIVQWPTNKQILLPVGIYNYFHLLVSNSIHPNTMATLVILLSPLPLTWSWQRFQQRAWGAMILLGGIWVLMILILLLTQSRGGFIAEAFGFLASVWLIGERKTAIALTALLVIAGIGLGVYAGHHQQGIPPFAERSINPATMKFRLHVWRIALWMIGDFPFTGVGMGLFNNVGMILYPFNETRNPGTHNLYLGIAVDLGLLGLIAFLSLQLTLARMARMLQLGKNPEGLLPEQQSLAAGMFAGLLGLFAHGLFDNTIWETRASLLLWLVIGEFTAAFLMKQTVSQEKPPVHVN